MAKRKVLAAFVWWGLVACANTPEQAPPAGPPPPPTSTPVSAPAAGATPPALEELPQGAKDALDEPPPTLTPAAHVVTPVGDAKLEGSRVTLKGDIKFDFDSTNFKKAPETKAALATLAEFMQKNPAVTKLRLGVKADTTGSPDHAVKLAQERADAVAMFLSAQGVSRDRLEVVGYGESHPLVAGLPPTVKSAFIVEEVNGTAPKESQGERIYYATDREQIAGPAFDGKRDPAGSTHFGECQVSVPNDAAHPRHRAWNILHLLGPDHADFGIIGIHPADDFPALAAPLAKDIASAGTDERDALVFVHGFNNTFEDACMRAGQLAFALGFHGPVFMFSWPSQGGGTGIAGYEEDLSNADDVSSDHFATFLESVATFVHPHAIHVLAHSMGSFVTLTALKIAPPGDKFHLGEVILAAGDVDVGKFNLAKDALAGRADRITVYASTADWALWWSRRKLLHGGYPRLGYEPPLTLGDWFDTIDASRVRTNPMGHDYIFEDTSIRDVRAVLNHEKPNAATRLAWLTKRSDPAGAVWYELPK